MKTHTFIFDYADCILSDAISDIQAFFKSEQIINVKANYAHEFPEITLTLKAHNANKLFASFYLRKPLSEITSNDVSEIKYFKAN